MTSVSRNVYINKLDDIVNKYSNTCHSTIKMKPADIKSNTYIDCNKEDNNKIYIQSCWFVTMLKYKNIFVKYYTPNQSEEVFGIKKVINTVPWTYIINDLNEEEIIGIFFEK